MLAKHSHVVAISGHTFCQRQKPNNTQPRFQVRKYFKICESDLIVIFLASVEKDNLLTSGLYWFD